jgi:hypothetical protein
MNLISKDEQIKNLRKESFEKEGWRMTGLICGREWGTSWFQISIRHIFCCGYNSIDVWFTRNIGYSVHLEAGPRKYGIGIASPNKVWQIYNGKYSSVRR